MSDSRRSAPRELPRGNAPLAPGSFRPNSKPPISCAGCGEGATALVFDPRGDYFTCGRSKCAPSYAEE